MSAVNVVLIAVAAQRKKIIDRLLELQADSPERAVSPAAIGRDGLNVLKSLKREGIVANASNDLIYVDRQRLASRKADNVIAGWILFGIVAVGVVVGLLVAIVHAI